VLVDVLLLMAMLVLGRLSAAANAGWSQLSKGWALSNCPLKRAAGRRSVDVAIVVAFDYRE